MRPRRGRTHSSSRMFYNYIIPSEWLKKSVIIIKRNNIIKEYIAFLVFLRLFLANLTFPLNSL
jgi:hypothetical protein